jgi:hypothetical protein
MVVILDMLVPTLADVMGGNGTTATRMRVWEGGDV